MHIWPGERAAILTKRKERNKVTSNPQRQQGVTVIGWIVILAIIGFFVLLILRLAPPYMENYSVKMALKSLKQDPDAYDLTVREANGRLQSYFDVNYVTTVPKGAVKINKGGGTLKVQIDYEVRVPIIANIDAVLTFNNEAEIETN
jgi:hypothetical protein